MALSDDSASADDRKPVKNGAVDAAQQRVGYKNPPTHTRFKGSGNPGGRPKKPPAPDFDNLIISLLEGKLPHSDKTWFDIILLGLAKAAAQGDIRATKYLCDRYFDAKHRKRSNGDNADADRQAAERLFASLGSLANQISDEKSELSSDATASAQADE